MQEGKCEHCSRTGQLVDQFVAQAQPTLNIEKAWVFRVYMCQWHRSAHNRNSTKPFKVTPFVDDSTLLAEYHQSLNQKQKTRI